MGADPRRIDEYTLGPLLGEGPTGPTYVATTTSSNGHLRRVALKLCHPTRSDLKPWVTALRREQDARLVRYEAVGGRTAERAGYVVTDVVRAQDYEELVTGAPLRARAEVAREVAEAVGVLHARRPRLVHGCLKPSNVIVRREPSGTWLPMITDAGIHPRYDPSVHDAPEHARGLYPYLAPEAARAFREGRPLPETAASDVYGLGALTCALLTGAGPGTTEGETTPEEILRAKRRRRYLVHALLPEGERLDLAAVGDVLARALAEAPEERPSAPWVADALRAALSPRRVPA